MTSRLKETLPPRQGEVKVSELAGKVVHAASSAAARLEVTVYDVIAGLLLLSLFIHELPWYACMTVMVVELALIRSSNAMRDRRLKEKAAALRSKSAK